MDWRRTGDTPMPGPIMTHSCDDSMRRLTPIDRPM